AGAGEVEAVAGGSVVGHRHDGERGRLVRVDDVVEGDLRPGKLRPDLPAERVTGQSAQVPRRVAQPRRRDGGVARTAARQRPPGLPVPRDEVDERLTADDDHGHLLSRFLRTGPPDTASPGGSPGYPRTGSLRCVS